MPQGFKSDIDALLRFGSWDENMIVCHEAVEKTVPGLPVQRMERHDDSAQGFESTESAKQARMSKKAGHRKG